MESSYNSVSVVNCDGLHICHLLDFDCTILVVRIGHLEAELHGTIFNCIPPCKLVS